MQIRPDIIAFLDKIGLRMDTRHGKIAGKLARGINTLGAARNHRIRESTKMKRTREAGFTLIELVVVIVILGILAAVAVPQFASLTSAAYSAVEQNACGAAQSQAVLLYASDKRSHTPTEIYNAINPGLQGVAFNPIPSSCVFTARATNNTGTPTTCISIPAGLCP
jgi:MSHA pilin protein MshA